ncbi:hypothetical protein AAFN86_07110 [Roseomonas sp. CAU 1739]
MDLIAEAYGMVPPAHAARGLASDDDALCAQREPVNAGHRVPPDGRRRLSSRTLVAAVAQRAAQRSRIRA